jgi:hypothetical protein
VHLRKATIPTAGGGAVRLQLETDSDHLARFFAANWASDDGQPDGTILALRGSAPDYGLDPDLEGARWYCPDSRQVWMFGTQYYGNVKITVRGLCTELAPFDDLFLHGCAMDIDGRGVALSGMSGAGKTTLTAALRRQFGKRLRIVNDDWGPLSLASGELLSTREPALHMKYPSVRALAPAVRVSPEMHLSENFAGDLTDAKARLMIAPHEVFGVEGLAARSRLTLFVVVFRQPGQTHARRASPDDLAFIESGQYSSFYDRTEWFLNGSLFLVDESRRQRCREQYRVLLGRFPCILLNNGGTPEEGARLIYESLTALGV